MRHTKIKSFMEKRQLKFKMSFYENGILVSSKIISCGSPADIRHRWVVLNQLP